jgi:hypothetical protein
MAGLHQVLGCPHILDWYVQPTSGSTARRFERLAADGRVASSHPHVEVDDAIRLLDDPLSKRHPGDGDEGAPCAARFLTKNGCDIARDQPKRNVYLLGATPDEAPSHGSLACALLI